MNGCVKRYKAHLVTKGFAQKYGVDYYEMFAPVVKFTLIRTLLLIGATLDMEIHQMDVKTVFLNIDIQEDVYMTVPDGYDLMLLSMLTNPICKLNRSLYSLKQSPRMWNKKIHDFLVSLSFR